MQTKVIKVDPQLPGDVVLRSAAEMVKNGNIVAFPTETVYGLACRVDKKSLEKLDHVKQRSEGKRYTLVIDTPSKLNNYVPEITQRTRKLVNKYWPGPLTVVFEFERKEIEILKRQFDDFVFNTLYHANTLGIRCPIGKIPQKLLEYADCPVVAPSANLSGNQPPVNAKGVFDQLEGRIELILDGGKCALKKPSTVVKVNAGKFEILREGAVTKNEIRMNSTLQVLFVCTGNTCRSPMAEGMCKSYLSEKFNCTLDQLPQFGYKILSAGVMAADGMSVSPEAVATCKKYGIDISGYTSTFLTDRLVYSSDLIFVMSRSHYDVIDSRFKNVKNKIFRLNSEDDIPDPIGTSREVYDRCGKVIFENIKKRFGSKAFI